MFTRRLICLDAAGALPPTAPTLRRGPAPTGEVGGARRSTQVADGTIDGFFAGNHRGGESRLGPSRPLPQSRATRGDLCAALCPHARGQCWSATRARRRCEIAARAPRFARPAIRRRSSRSGARAISQRDRRPRTPASAWPCAWEGVLPPLETEVRARRRRIPTRPTPRQPWRPPSCWGWRPPPPRLADYAGVRRRQTVLSTEGRSDGARGLRAPSDGNSGPADEPAPPRPDRGRLIVVFQPHRRSRTAQFKAEFAAALTLADRVHTCSMSTPRASRRWPAARRADIYAELKGRNAGLPVGYLRRREELVWGPGARSLPRRLGGFCRRGRHRPPGQGLAGATRRGGGPGTALG